MDTLLTCCSSSRCVAPASANPRALRRLLQSCASSSASCSSSCTGLPLQQQQLAAIVAVQQQRQHCGTRSSNCSTSHESVEVEEDEEEGFSRRGFLGCLVAVPLLLQQSLVCCNSYERGAASAAETTTTQLQQQYRKYVDRLDGYEFNYPAGWIQVRGAGADVFFRDPVNLDENVLVEISSPSSSKFKGVQDLGSPEQAGKKVLRQYLTEFMSTRLGVRRESNIVATGSRLGDDGRLYYDVEVLSLSLSLDPIAEFSRVSSSHKGFATCVTAYETLVHILEGFWLWSSSHHSSQPCIATFFLFDASQDL